MGNRGSTQGVPAAATAGSNANTNTVHHVDFSLTTGKPITCSGWVAEKGASGWSTRNVALKHDVVIPVPARHQVRVRVYAAGINPADTQRTAILQPPDEGSSDGMGRHRAPTFSFPYTCGLEGAGVVESVGWDSPSYSDIRVGDRVMYLADITMGAGGSFCQYAVVDADIVCKLQGPTSPAADSRMLDFVEAATLPVAAQTAYVSLFDKLRIEKGRSIFISGASGGVGSIAVQLAHHFGLRVFASCSTRNLRYVEELGADVVLDYTNTNVVGELMRLTDNYGVDYVLEAASASLAEAHAEAIRFGGSICVITGYLESTCDLVFRRQLSIHYVFLGMFHQSRLARQQLKALGWWVQRLYLQGAFDVKVEEVSFDRADVAMDVIAQGHTRAKVALTGFHADELATERQRRHAVKASMKAAKSSPTQ